MEVADISAYIPLTIPTLHFSCGLVTAIGCIRYGLFRTAALNRIIPVRPLGITSYDDADTYRRHQIMCSSGAYKARSVKTMTRPAMFVWRRVCAVLSPYTAGGVPLPRWAVWRRVCAVLSPYTAGGVPLPRWAVWICPRRRPCPCPKRKAGRRSVPPWVCMWLRHGRHRHKANFTGAALDLRNGLCNSPLSHAARRGNSLVAVPLHTIL